MSGATRLGSFQNWVPSAEMRLNPMIDGEECLRLGSHCGNGSSLLVDFDVPKIHFHFVTPLFLGVNTTFEVP